MNRPSSAEVRTVLTRLDGVRPSGNGWQARCPAHDDTSPSLSIGEGDDGRLLLKCHVGCQFEDVVAALDLPSKQPGEVKERRRIVEAYTYRDANGEPLFEVVRFEPKGFAQRRPDGTWGLGGVEPVLYRLPAVLASARSGGCVMVCEGERDVHTLEQMGLTATTAPMGAGKWRDRYSHSLKGAHVVVLPDNDGPGRSHAKTVAESVCSHATSVCIVELPNLAPKGDVTDWVEMGGTTAELQQIVSKAEPWTPSAEEVEAENFGMLASEIEPERIAWLWERRLPLGELSILDGDPGLGKSTLMADLAARVTTGRSMPQGGPPAEAVEGACIVVVRHLNKSGGTAAIYRGGGSIGIIGAARVALLLGCHPEDEDLRILTPVKNNLAPFPSALASGPRLARELYDEADAEGVAQKTLQRAKKALGVDSYKEDFRGPWMWCFSEEGHNTASANSGSLRANEIKNTFEKEEESPFNGDQSKVVNPPPPF